MGLDISAASHLKYVGPVPRGKSFDRLEAECEAKGKSLHDLYFLVYPNGAYHRARLRGTRPGLYEYTKPSRRFSFAVGGYTYYNWWRNELSLFALGDTAEDVWAAAGDYRGEPFYELIDFTDCDGRIGTAVCAKLAADFTSHVARAKRFAATVTDEENPTASADWLMTYRDFARAFRLAAKGGALRFC